MKSRTSVIATALVLSAIWFLMGATVFTKARLPVEGVPWGYGTVSVPTSTGGTNTRHKFSPINVLARGVVGDGTTDDSDSLQAVVDEIEAFGAGAMYLPATSGGYLCNLIINGDNVTIIGDGGTSLTTGSVTSLKAADPTLPIINVDGTVGQVEGLHITGITLDGDGTSDYGLKISGGHKCYFDHISIMDFEKYALRVTSGAVRTSHILFDDFNMTNSDSNTVELYYGSQYTTVVRFSHGQITDGNNAGSRAIMSVGVRAYMHDVWMDVHDGQGILLKNSGAHLGQIIGMNVSLDSGDAADVLLETGDNTPLYQRLFGGITIDGLVKFGNDSTAYWQGDYMLGDGSTMFDPTIQGSLYFADPHDSVATRYTTDSQHEARFYYSGNNLIAANTSGGDFIFSPSGAGKVYFDNTGGTYNFNKTLYVDSLLERTSAAGIRADGTLLKDSIFRGTSARLDTLAMKTALHGVVVDPILPINSTARAADDTLLAAENVIFFTGQTGNVFATLPTYATVPVGKTYIVINCDAAATDSVFIEANGAEFLNGLATRRAVGLRGYDAASGYFRAKIMYVNSAVGWARVD